MNSYFNFSPELIRFSKEAEMLAAPYFKSIGETVQYNQEKVLAAMAGNRVAETHFAGSTGYGYDDRGRELLDRVYADSFGCEDALVRHTFVNGTHAIATAMFALLRPGDTMLSLTGKPYDTLWETIGGEQNGSLKDYGIAFCEVPMKAGRLDLPAAKRGLLQKPAVVYLQRSRGYDCRETLSTAEMEAAFRYIREHSPGSVILVDNCYGEFTAAAEPAGAGADLMAGSLIKNPGGGLARTGGYIAGKKELVTQCACRLTAPGIGKEVGCTLSELRNMFQGFFLAPHVTGEALKTAVYAAALFELLGFEVSPRYQETRYDIIQTVTLKNAENLICFCKGIQAGSPVDAHLSPNPWDMPGYRHQVIMAAGTFTQGASIELSCDAPMKEPYTAFLQGGLTFESGKIGILSAARQLMENQ